jgi:hypothetical protein
MNCRTVISRSNLTSERNVELQCRTKERQGIRKLDMARPHPFVDTLRTLLYYPMLTDLESFKRNSVTTIIN